MTGLTSSLRANISSFGLVVLLCVMTLLDAKAADEVHEFQIPVATADVSLKLFSLQSGYPVIFRSKDVNTVLTNPISGGYTVRDALDAMFLDSGLAADLTTKEVVTVSAGNNEHNGKELEKVSAENKNILGALGHAVATFFAGSGPTAIAAEADTSADAEDRIEEIVVTATKRAQNQQDVPMTISVLSQAAIEAQGLEDGGDIARLVPGIVKTGQGRSLDSSYLIRGIGTSSNPGTDLSKPASIYLDDIPITSNNAGTQPDLQLFDVSRIEVLKGPQGTLFGSGTLSGVVRVVTNKADPSAFSYKLRTELASMNGSLRHRYKAMVNAPISDKAAVRIAGYIHNEDGYMRNIGTERENSNSIDDEGLRASLTWDASENFTVSASYTYQSMEADDFDAFNPETGRKVTGSWLAHGIESEFDNFNLTLVYDFGIATLTSSTNSYEFDSKTVIDLDAIGNNAPWAAYSFPWAMTRLDAHENFVQELRLVSNSDSRVNWVVGYFMRDSDNDFDWTHYTDPEFVAARKITGLVSRPDIGVDNVFVNTPLRTNEDKERAFYAEVSYRITDALTVSVGAREGTVESTDFRDGRGGNAIGSMIEAQKLFFATNGENDEYPVTFEPNVFTKWGTGGVDVNTLKASLMWQATDDMNLFVLASEGFRGPAQNPGAFRNGGVSFVDPTDVVIQPNTDSDSLWNYEIGMKASWLHGRLNSNVTLFYIDWEDLQFFARRRADGEGFITNIGAAESKGLEVEVRYKPNATLELGFGFSSINAEITELTELEAIMVGAAVGDELVTPDFSAVGFAQYTRQLQNGYELFVRGDIQHVSAYPNAFPLVAGQQGVTNDLFGTTDSYENVNFSVGIVSDNWTASLFGENIFDNDDSINIDSTASFTYRHRALTPRSFGVRLSYQRE
ncbi:TonB-dependent receptor [Gammaproteobacteria bacterium]|nr:TonB-dependent receptor [Gammaproteobacteria bacterium]